MSKLDSATIITKAGETTTFADAVKDKDYVFLYFSASWCGPCKAFTPKLADFYKKHKDAKKFEIIFMSGDRDEESFKGYYDHHPWLAVYEPALYRELMTKYKVEGIPTLILLDAKTGEAVTKDGRMYVMTDEDADLFPWLPSLSMTTFGTTVVNKSHAEVSLADAVKDKDYVFLYFSASWCGPCKAFTPKLVEFYNKHKDAKKFEIIFMSLDRDEESFKEYYGHHPWLAVYGDRCKMAAQTCKVQGIPTLVLIDAKKNTVITNDAVSEVSADPEAAAFPWPATAAGYFGGAKEVLTKSDAPTTVDDVIAGCDYTMMYFSASWCPPCKMFTPKLAEFYKKYKTDKKFEIVFMSLDRDEESFKEYYGHHPWLAVGPSGDTVQKAASKVGIDGIPSLIVIDNKTGAVVTSEGVEALMGDEEGSDFPWE